MAQDFSELLAAFNSSDFKQSISMGEELLKRYPKNAELRYYLARSYMKQGQLALAETHLHTALSFDPNEDVKSNCILALKEISQSNSSANSASPSKQQSRTMTSTPNAASSVGSASSTKGISNYQPTIRRAQTKPSSVQTAPNAAVPPSPKKKN